MASLGLWPTWRTGLAYFSGNSEMLGRVKIVTNRSGEGMGLPEMKVIMASHLKNEDGDLPSPAILLSMKLSALDNF